MDHKPNISWELNLSGLDRDLYVTYTAGQQFANLAAADPAELYQNRFVIKMHLFLSTMSTEIDLRHSL